MALLEWPSAVLILASTALVVLMLVRTHLPKKRQTNLPPGPPPLPIVGNLHQLGRMPHLSLQRLAHRYGPIFHLTLGHIPTVIVSSARTAKEVLRTHDLPLSSRPQLHAAKQLFYGCTDIVFSPYGNYWRQIRKICTLELLSARRVESYRPARAAEVDQLVRRIAAASSGPGGAVSLSRLLGLYANGVLCRAAFGREFAEGGEYDRHGFQKMLEEYQALLGGFSLADFYPSLEWVNAVTGMKRRLARTFKRFDCLFDEIIEEHRKRRKRSEEDKDLVDLLLDIHKDGSLEMPLTMDNVKAIILDMFAAGTDTTFITLDWGMTELLMNPKALKRAQDEVRSIVGGRRTVSEGDLPQLHYLKAVIKEIFRMHPPAPLLVPRESMEEVTIDGYQIPAKTRIFVNAWAIGRDPESWKNPQVFEPERFLDSSIDFKGQDFELLPFGAGRRGCPAITFGMASIEIALAQLLHSFDWELPHGVKPEYLDMKEAFGITMHRIAELVAVAKPHSII
ncbi:cytochrome P450 71AP13-like [Phoenix dactylifera]|uniref:Cytochrome P450 71AP13-like n=1 Tax=Phoenix dactylifera TaxID=42345 RepID=A0A8B9A083_PHODC|nr:cytochrome P450 71AP13-like [Phoenix dactylifera]